MTQMKNFRDGDKLILKMLFQISNFSSSSSSSLLMNGYVEKTMESTDEVKEEILINDDGFQLQLIRRIYLDYARMSGGNFSSCNFQEK